MLKISYDRIVEKIREKTQSSLEEIENKVKSKMDQLAGLISKEGAAHIVANEMGVKIIEETSGKLKIKNVISGMRDVEVIGKVQRIFEVREFQKEDRTGKVGSIILADETGNIRVTFWNDQTDVLKEIKENDIIKIEKSYVRDNQGRPELQANDKTQVIINPPGEKIEEVKSFSITRKNIEKLDENDLNIEILGTIVSINDIRFFEKCPTCNKRLRISGDKFNCLEHGEVSPNYSYVLNLVLDDGTSNIRAVFFGKQLEKLIEKDDEEILKIKDDEEKFDKNELLGKIVKIIGKTNRNQMFDRLEFIANIVYPNPDPKEELKKITQQ